MAINLVITMTNNNEPRTMNYSKQTQSNPTCGEQSRTICSKLVRRSISEGGFKAHLLMAGLGFVIMLLCRCFRGAGGSEPFADCLTCSFSLRRPSSYFLRANSRFESYLRFRIRFWVGVNIFALQLFR